MIFLRNVAVGVGISLVAVYLVVFALLVVYQRDMLFFRGRYARPIDEPYRALVVREKDGVSLRVRVAAPPRPGAPEIVFFYGNAGTLSDFAGAGGEFQRDGYGVVLASYRGYDGNPGSPSEAGLMDDARAVLASLPKDHGPVVLWGQSLGSGIAARMAAEGRADALILQSPYTAVVDVAARDFPVYPVRLVMWDRFDTLSLVPRISVPVLIMHGTADETVPFDMGRRLAHSLAHARFVPIPGGSHNLYDDALVPIAQRWLNEFPLPLWERKKNHGFGLSAAKTKPLIFQVRGESGGPK